MQWWFDLDDLIAKFEVMLWDVDIAKTAHRHGDWTCVHRCCNGGGGEESEKEQQQRQCDNQPD